MVNAIIAVDSLMKQTSILMKCSIPSPFKKRVKIPHILLIWAAYFWILGRIFLRIIPHFSRGSDCSSHVQNWRKTQEKLEI